MKKNLKQPEDSHPASFTILRLLNYPITREIFGDDYKQTKPWAVKCYMMPRNGNGQPWWEVNKLSSTLVKKHLVAVDLLVYWF